MRIASWSELSESIACCAIRILDFRPMLARLPNSIISARAGVEFDRVVLVHRKREGGADARILLHVIFRYAVYCRARALGSRSCARAAAAPASTTTLNTVPKRAIKPRLALYHDCFVPGGHLEDHAGEFCFGRAMRNGVGYPVTQMGAIALMHRTQARQAGLRGSALRTQESRWRRGRECRSGFGFLARQKEARP
jgi:hypothetical protein